MHRTTNAARTPVDLAKVNRMNAREFLDAFGGVFEHSPWVAARAWQRRPFDSIEGLFREMQDAVHEAKPEAQLELIRAHPELAGKQGPLTSDSSSEQARLGFLSLERGHFEQMGELNRTYRQRFGIPCIVALKLHASRASVMAEMQRRLGNTVQAEIATALEQIGHIARGRLEKIVKEK
jgi:OHCU decarboxylase